MCALAHLIRAHTLISRRLIVRDDATQCTPAIGSPGGVYFCGGNTDSCQWLAPSETKVCVPYNVIELGPPLLIGPDYGGACRLYTSESCEEDSAVVFAQEVGDVAVRKGVPGSFVCPGIEGRDVPVEIRSFRCWAMEKEGSVLSE